VAPQGAPYNTHGSLYMSLYCGIRVEFELTFFSFFFSFIKFSTTISTAALASRDNERTCKLQ
jgi:hypothetical protein